MVPVWYNSGMEKKTTELYSPDEPALLEKKARGFTALCVVIGALTLAGCIYICTKVDPVNVSRMLIAAFALSTLGGWIVISIAHFVVGEYKNAAKHCRAILDGEGETVEGRFAVEKEVIRIKHGVAMRTVRQEGAERAETLRIFTKKAKLFDAEKAVSVRKVLGFVAAYEVEDENN